MSENILEMQNVTTCVNEGTSEEKEILKNISLNVKKGDFITLLGTNGAGKSTLLNVINGSLSPRSGSLHFAGLPRSQSRHGTTNDGGRKSSFGKASRPKAPLETARSEQCAP